MKFRSPSIDRTITEEAYDEQAVVSDIAAGGDALLRRMLASLGRMLVKPFQAARYDIPTAVFVSLAMLSGFVCRTVIAANAFGPKAIFSDFAIFSIFGAVGFLIGARRRPAYYISISAFFTFFLFVDSLYFRSHASVLSLFLLPQLQFLPEVADACRVLVEWTDVSYLLSIAALIGALIWLRRRGLLDPEKESRGLRVRKALTCLTMALVILGVFGASLSRLEASRLGKQWNRPYLVERFGPYGYHIGDIIKFGVSLQPFAQIEPGELQEVVSYFRERRAQRGPANEYRGLLAGQNLVVIHGESLQSLFLFRSVNGVEITPNINRIARQGLYFNRFYAQNSIGTSSDSEFSLLTSLYPINSGTVFISHAQHSFLSMPRKLQEQGYTTLALHGNNSSFWNRQIMNRQLGYQRFYSKTDYEMDEEIGMGLSDMSFLRQSLGFLLQTPQPFMATLITLTNHTPFAEVDKYGEFDAGSMEGTKTGNYFKSLHYMDRAIGRFFDGLSECGLLENTTVVIYGDHPASLERKEIGAFLGRAEYDRYDHRIDRTVPLIIWSRRLPAALEIDEPMGMIDVFPTLANMFGFDAEFAMGHDIFSVTDNRVVFPDGSWLDRNVVFFDSDDTFKIHNEVFVQGYLRQRCRAGLATRDSLIGGPTSTGEQPGSAFADCDYPAPKRAFKHRRGRPGEDGLGSSAYDYVRTRNLDVARQLEISSRILDFDLLRPSDADHPHSLLDFH